MKNRSLGETGPFTVQQNWNLRQRKRLDRPDRLGRPPETMVITNGRSVKTFDVTHMVNMLVRELGTLRYGGRSVPKNRSNPDALFAQSN